MLHDASTGSTAAVLAIGGLDPSGGAGLGRDLLTAEALGAGALLVGTAWTLQATPAAGRPGGVLAVDARDPTRLRDDIVAALAIAAGERLAVKIGMIATAAAVPAVLEGLSGFTGPVVYDPVLGATSGGRLYQGSLDALTPLLARATLITPNLAEAAHLSGLAVSDEASAETAARALLATGARAVLVKGGHLAGDAVDLLATTTTFQRFTSPRIPGPSPRGTGCALATAIAIALARGAELDEAVATAKAWLHDRIANAIDRGGERRL